MTSLICKIDVHRGEAGMKPLQSTKKGTHTKKGKHTVKVGVTTLHLKAISQSFRDSLDVRLGAGIIGCCTAKIITFEIQMFR